LTNKSFVDLLRSYKAYNISADGILDLQILRKLMLDDGFTAFLICFAEWMRMNDYSQRTIENWQVRVGYFFSWAEERGLRRPQEITEDILTQYEEFLNKHRNKKGSALSFHTQRAYLKPVKAYFKWLVKNNYASLE
jgi:integrase/recombinase XerD